MVVGEAKAIYMALRGDGKGEVGTTEGILESDMAPASPGFQHHTLGDQESFCRQRAGQGQWQTHTASPLCPICFSFTAKALAGRLGRDSCPYYTEEETEARRVQVPHSDSHSHRGNIYLELTMCQTVFYVNSFNFTTNQ